MRYAELFELVNKFAQQSEKSGLSLIDIFRTVKFNGPTFDCTIWASVENGLVKLTVESQGLNGFKRMNMMDSEEAQYLQAEVAKYSKYLQTSVAPQMQKKLAATLRSEGTDLATYNMNPFELQRFEVQ